MRTKVRSSVGDILNLRYPLDNQEMWRRQLDMTVWSSEEMKGLETGIQTVIKWYFKPCIWMRSPRNGDSWRAPVFREVEELREG